MEHLMQDVAAILHFLMAGNATFTLVSPSGARRTFRVHQSKKDKTKYGPDSRRVALLTGPNNETDYTGLGYIRDGKFTPWNNMAESEACRIVTWATRKLFAGNDLHGVQFWHEGRCGRCGHKLTVPDSIAAGIGPECAGKTGTTA